MLGQTGIFGAVSAHLKAGDLAPEIVFTRILNTGHPLAWSFSNFSGKLTVLVFYPDTSHNLESVSEWNGLLDQFAGKPIQFAWITGEDESSLIPWLREHPIKGWVFHDPGGATGRSYGIEYPATVIVGKDGRIVGFDPYLRPTADMLNAVLEDRVTTVPPQFTISGLDALTKSGKVLLNAVPPQLPRPDDNRPRLEPSYKVHISPAESRDGNDLGGDNFRGFRDLDLKGAMAQLFDTNPARIVLPPELDNGKRYDIEIVLPKPDSEKEISNRIRQEIESYFHVTATREERRMDVYVVTTIDENPPKTKIERGDSSDFSGGSIGSLVVFDWSRPSGGSDEFPSLPAAHTLSEVRSISLDGTVDELCRTLEYVLDRPVVNETNLDGEFAFRVKAGENARNDYLQRLRDELNLSIDPAERRVQIVALSPTGLSQYRALRHGQW